MDMQKNALREAILDLSRQNQIGELSPWFSAQLDRQIEAGYFLSTDMLEVVESKIVNMLVRYREDGDISTCVLGMSGGVDSALTAALFKKAGWKVIGVTLPIHQDPSETERGVEAIQALNLDEHVHVDLSAAYDMMLTATLDEELNASEASKSVKIRRGNIRARLRMITLYNLASKNKGLVASTDNLSELASSFFSLHGDVGDLSPIQSLMKSWEVPYISKISGVPEKTVRATPTDGLGIDAGDEAQLGCSYLEWDLLVNAISQVVAEGDTREDVRNKLELGGEDRAKFNAVESRMRAGWFKRYNPMKLPHPLADRYGMLEKIDKNFLIPTGLLSIL